MLHGSREVIMYGRHVMMGYLFDPDMTSEVIDERGWFHTKDLGQVDRLLFLYIVSIILLYQFLHVNLVKFI